MGRGHDGVRPRCGEVDTMGGGHNGGGHDDEASRGSIIRKEGRSFSPGVEKGVGGLS